MGPLSCAREAVSVLGRDAPSAAVVFRSCEYWEIERRRSSSSIARSRTLCVDIMSSERIDTSVESEGRVTACREEVPVVGDGRGADVDVEGMRAGSESEEMTITSCPGSIGLLLLRSSSSPTVDGCR